MVSSADIITMGLWAVICFLLPIVAFVYFKKKENLSFKPCIVGAVVFVVFVFILEASLHKLVIGNGLVDNPIIYSIYGAFAAGIFEETGRFIAFKTVLKNNHEWKDGFAYGIGHGGIEAVLLGGFVFLNNVITSISINNGSFDTMLNSNLTAAQIDQFNQVKESLIQSTVFLNSVTGVNRVFAFCIQLALTMVVLYAIRYRKNIYLFVAILLHAAVDFPAVLAQKEVITNEYVLEGILVVEFIISILFLLKTKKILSKEEAI